MGLNVEMRSVSGYNVYVLSHTLTALGWSRRLRHK